jgi:hypothetical protein
MSAVAQGTARAGGRFLRNEGWRLLGPLLAQPKIDYDAVEALVERMAEQWPGESLRRIVGAIREIESTGSIDLDRYERIQAQAMVSGLVMTGRMRTVRIFLERACKRWPNSPFQKTAGVLLPAPEVPAIGSFLDQPWSDMQVVEQGGTTTFVVFCAIGHRFGVDLNVIHLWLRQPGANIIYLRDFTKSLYLQGIQSLGDYAATVEKLRATLTKLGTRKIVCIGYSAGVFGALLLGRDIPADLVLALAGPSTIELGTLRAESRPHYATLEALRTSGKLEFPDLAKDYATNKVRVRYLYPELNDFDKRQAENLLHCPGVTLEAVEGSKQHFIVPELIRRGQFAQLLRDAAA